VGEALGVPSFEIERLTAHLPHSAGLEELEDVRAVVPECHDLPLEDAPFRDLIRLARAIEGLPRHISIHCGGIVISPRPITDLIPLQRTPKGFVVTQYDMYPVEDLGLLKIDLLAQRLAAELAPDFTDTQTLAKHMWEVYQIKLAEARTTDAQEGTPRDTVDVSPWVLVRA